MSDIEKSVEDLWKKVNEIELVVNKNKFDGAVAAVDSVRVSDKSFATLDKRVRLVEERQRNVRDRLRKIEDDMENLALKYVTKDQYAVVRYIVITTAGLMFVGLITSIIKLVLPHAEFPT